ALATCHSRLEIVGSDEKQALACRRIRVHSDHWNARCDGAINVVLHRIRIRNRDQNARRLFLYRCVQFGALCRKIVAVGSSKGVANPQLLGRLREARSGILPIRNFDVYGNQHIVLPTVPTSATDEWKKPSGEQETNCIPAGVHGNLLSEAQRERQDSNSIASQNERSKNFW